jgi:hypothetical protein
VDRMQVGLENRMTKSLFAAPLFRLAMMANLVGVGMIISHSLLLLMRRLFQEWMDYTVAVDSLNYHVHTSSADFGSSSV